MSKSRVLPFNFFNLTKFKLSNFTKKTLLIYIYIYKIGDAREIPCITLLSSSTCAILGLIGFLFILALLPLPIF